MMSRERAGVRRWFSAPAFESEELSRRARILHRTVWSGMAVVTVGMVALIAAQPSTTIRPLMTLIGVDLIGLAAHEVSRRGRPYAGSILAVGGLIAMTTLLALAGGGIRSAGITIHFAFVMLAGVLLGPMWALRTALVCAAVATGLVAAELTGVIEPTPTDYGPLGLLVIDLLFLTVVLMLTFVASRSMTGALHRAETELTERREAE